jgi:hypothetical protein
MILYCVLGNMSWIDALDALSWPSDLSLMILWLEIGR